MINCISHGITNEDSCPECSGRLRKATTWSLLDVKSDKDSIFVEMDGGRFVYFSEGEDCVSGTANILKPEEKVINLLGKRIIELEEKIAKHNESMKVIGKVNPKQTELAYLIEI